MNFGNVYDELTPTERRVLRFCLDDVPCKTIADKLCMSVETVKTHRKHIARKLGVSGKTEFRQALRRIEREVGLPFTQELTPNSP